MQQIWREPAEESTDLYPGLVLHDNRQSGSITVGRSRVSLWAICTTAILGSWKGKPDPGWGNVEDGWELTRHSGFDGEDFAHFIYCLLEHRGEFGRLVLVLADAERRESRAGRAWWETKAGRARLRRQLKRCLAALDSLEAA